MGGEAEFRKQDQGRLPFGRLAHQRDSLLAVKGRIGHSKRGQRHGNTGKVVIVEIEEVLARFHFSLSPLASRAGNPCTLPLSRAPKRPQPHVLPVITAFLLPRVGGG